MPAGTQRYPQRAGVPAINATTAGVRAVLRSELEHRFAEFVDEYGLPRPSFNVTMLGYECDAVWPEARFIVELDGGAHDLPNRRESDRERDRKLTVAGWRVIRVTWRQLHDDADALARDLQTLVMPASAQPSRRRSSPNASTGPSAPVPLSAPPAIASADQAMISAVKS